MTIKDLYIEDVDITGAIFIISPQYITGIFEKEESTAIELSTGSIIRVQKELYSKYRNRWVNALNDR